VSLLNKHLAGWLGGGLLLGGGCGGEPSVPEHPTWADVQPIIKGECSQCHGATASTTGFGYRLDFYDMTVEACGEAARALSGGTLAATAAPSIVTDVTPPAGGGHARMPPAPGPALHDWERETLLRWASQPIKGPPPGANHAPTIQVSGLPKVVSDSLRFSALVEDTDGDEVVGLLKIADAVFAMRSSGSFSVEIPSKAWPAGPQRLTAILCDGWASVPYDLGPVDVKH
jgi:hypothetical protein